MKRRGGGAVVAFGATSFFSDLAHEAVSAVLPALMLSLGAPPIGLGVVEGVSDAAASFLKLLSGRLADRIPRLKPATITGYVVTGLAIPAIGFATSWLHVLLLRTAAWVGRGFRSPLRDLLLTRSVPEDRRGAAFGLERAMDQCGALLAPLIVVLLVRADVALASVVKLSIIPGVLSAAALLVGVRESRPADPPAPSTPAALPATDGRLRRLLVALAVFGSGDFAKTLLVLWALGDDARPERGVTVGLLTTSALLYAGFNAVTIGAAFVGGRLSDRVGRRRVLVFGYVCGALGAAVPVFSAPSIAAGCIALAFSGLLVGVEEAVERAWAADLVPGGKRGRAFGAVHAVNGLGDLVASVLVAVLWQSFGPPAAFGAASAIMFAGVILVSRLR